MSINNKTNIDDKVNSDDTTNSVAGSKAEADYEPTASTTVIEKSETKRETTNNHHRKGTYIIYIHISYATNLYIFICCYTRKFQLTFLFMVL